MIPRTLLCFVLIWGGAFAQLKQNPPLQRYKAVSVPVSDFRTQSASRPARQSSARSSASGDSVHILALMVDFQSDDDANTSGDGKFQLQTNITGLIDPPPHSINYFTGKLKFVENYFKKVSNGKMKVTGDVFSQVVTLSKQMSSYAPAAYDGSVSPLTDLAIESWRKADSLFPGINFSQYDVFVIFHAGAGKDIDLVNLLGFDPTPYDIPSLFLGLKAFQNARNDLSFNGIPVDGGAFRITNTIILPETETRVVSSGASTDTVKLSINGLFAASIGSYLGLPDLFDTKTGRQGIGQFGLMDGAAIFAYAGLFPPEPSAWEKIYLGWTTPIIVNTNQTVTLPAVSLNNDQIGAQDTIYKIPISQLEYFLLENRNRDPQGNGQRLTIQLNNNTYIRFFPHDSLQYFGFDNVRGIEGSVIDVEDFDWALIGRIDGSGLYDGGGILVWHIDEQAIGAGLATNTVNADPNRRGVNLEEADGSQDIGRSYDFLEPGSGTESGSPLDCWFKENPSPVYKNIFDKNSFPNSRSNDGSLSLVTIKDFSKRSSRMTATIQFGDDIAKPLTGFPQQMNGVLSGPIPFDLDNEGKAELMVTRTLYSGPDGRSGSPVGRGALIARRQDGSPYFAGGDSLGIVAEVDSPFVGKVVILKHPVTNTVYLAASSDGVYLWKAEDANADFRFDRVFKVPALAGNLMFVDTLLVVYGSNKSTTLNLQGAVQSVVSVPSDYTAGGAPAGDACRIGATDNVAFVLNDSLKIANVRTGQVLGQAKLEGAALPSIVAGDLTGGGSAQVVVVTAKSYTQPESKQQLSIFDATGRIILQSNEIVNSLYAGDNLLSPILLCDLDGDGKKDIVLTTAKGRIFALNYQGRLLDGYPKAAMDRPSSVQTVPLVGDMNGDGKPEIIFMDVDGVLHIVPLDSGPVFVNSIRLSNTSFSHPSLFPVFSSGGSTVGFANVDASGRFAVLDFQKPYVVSKTLWPMNKYDPAQTSYAGISTVNPAPVSSEFIPKSRVYNWPNPAYGSTTQIRYYVSQDADVSVKIFDLAGSKITELHGRGAGGADNEITWDVSNIQSGVYLARVEASGGDKSEVAVIKIAVVK